MFFGKASQAEAERRKRATVLESEGVRCVGAKNVVLYGKAMLPVCGL